MNKTDDVHPRWPLVRGLCQLAIVGAALLSGAAGAATRTYIVTDFDSIRVEGALDVRVETGRGASARGEGDRAGLEALELQVNSRTLTVRSRPSAAGASVPGSLGALRLTLTTPSLRRVNVSGAGILQVSGLTSGEAQVSASGNGRVEITGVASDSLQVTQTGGGTITLAGRTRNARIRVLGDGSVDAAAMRVSDLDVSVNGAGSADAVAERAASAQLVGSGSITVGGRPACSVRQAGGGTVRCGNIDR